MRAMVLEASHQPLRSALRDIPEPGPGSVLIKVEACGVCRTDVHVVDGELTSPALPLIPGHQIVGRVDRLGANVDGLREGDRVGVTWMANTCGACGFCRAGQENLCPHAQFTGYTLDGGFADYAVAHAAWCFPLDNGADPLHLAPLLCAGVIGYRSLRFAGGAQTIGVYGFGAAAHILTQVAAYQGRRVLAFTRAGDDAAQELARNVGAEWTGASGDTPRELLDAAIIFAPAGELVPAALAAVRPGGVVVCGGIHMSDIPSFPYSLLWQERAVRSVANTTAADAREFLPLAQAASVQTHVERFDLEHANEAVNGIRAGSISGAAVLDLRQA